MYRETIEYSSHLCPYIQVFLFKLKNWLRDEFELELDILDMKKIFSSYEKGSVLNLIMVRHKKVIVKNI